MIHPRPDDGLGYDFSWQDHDDFLHLGRGAEIMFEAKGTKQREFHRFFLSGNEYEVAQDVAQAGDTYILVCVSNVLGERPEIRFVEDLPAKVQSGEVGLRALK